MEGIVVFKMIRETSDSDDSSRSDIASSSSEFEELYRMNRELQGYHPIQNYFEEVIPRYTVDEFKSHFRMSRVSLEILLEDLRRSYIEVKPGKSPIPVNKALLMTIWILSNQESYRSVADRFQIRKGNAHTVVIKICKLLYKLREKYILWPKGQAEIKNVEKFNILRGPNSFPNVFGCVDGTHIPVPAVKDDDSYLNRKGNHSIIAQIICDANLQIINVSCGWPGSYHDARVWRSSTIYKQLNENINGWLPQGTYLLGDSAYPISKFVITPFRDNGHLTNQQKRFYRKLSCTRVIVENSIGRLKGLFRKLKFLNIVNLKYGKYFIISSVMLHNIAIKDGVYYEEDSDNYDECDGIAYDGVENHEGNELRLNIMRTIC